MKNKKIQKNFSPKLTGFTFVELIIVISIISALFASAIFAYRGLVERGRLNQALADVQAIRGAVEAYHADLGFYPPDSPGRGVDPGLAEISAPTCATNCPRGYNPARIVDASGNPVDWRGPYLEEWPDQTPWGGEYDYNYRTTVGSSCNIEAGIYIAILSPIPQNAEERFMAQRQDADGCADPNGNVHVLIKRL